MQENDENWNRYSPVFRKTFTILYTRMYSNPLNYRREDSKLTLHFYSTDESPN